MGDMTALSDWLTDPKQPTRPDDMLSPFLFRYMGGDGLLYTVRDRKLRMNAWSQMNDPREARAWRSAGGLTATGGLTDEEMHRRIDDVMRRSARLMSLTDDRKPKNDAPKDQLFHRGWARAALWSHYADGHRGVCLVLRSEDLMASIREMPSRDGRYTTWGHVAYRDRPIEIDLSGSFADLDSLDKAIEEFLDERYRISGLHMTKNWDWSYEAEVRLATVDLRADERDLDTPLMVPLDDCLVGVIFGDAHPNPKVVADGIRSDLGSSAPEIFRCKWEGGAPRLVILG
jgi:hypothetical protein